MNWTTIVLFRCKPRVIWDQPLLGRVNLVVNNMHDNFVGFDLFTEKCWQTHRWKIPGLPFLDVFRLLCIITSITIHMKSNSERNLGSLLKLNSGYIWASASQVEIFWQKYNPPSWKKSYLAWLITQYHCPDPEGKFIFCIVYIHCREEGCIVYVHWLYIPDDREISRGPRDVLRAGRSPRDISRQCTAILSLIIHHLGCIMKYTPLGHLVLTVLKSILPSY